MIALSYNLEAHPRVDRPLERWPPVKSTPVSFNSDGEVVSCFEDDVWDFTFSAGKICRVPFLTENGSRNFVSERNKLTFKYVVAWWLFGYRKTSAPASIRTYAARFSRLIDYANNKGIDVTQLSHHPELVRDFASTLATSHGDVLVVELRSLLTFEAEIGFTILDLPTLTIFSKSLPSHLRRQTAYIPTRIWNYQLLRLHNFLQDFVKHERQLLGAYNEASSTYKHNHDAAWRSSVRHKVGFSPFTAACQRYPGAEYLGGVDEFLEKWGLTELIARWRSGGKRPTITTFGSIFSMASFVSAAYIANLTGMRIGEVVSLKTGCLKREQDSELGDVYFIQGETTKTIANAAALWVTCKNVELAICALNIVASARSQTETALKDGQPLFTWCEEPWSSQRGMQPAHNVRAPLEAYSAWEAQHSGLFDPDELRIRGSDLDEARRVTPTLDQSRYVIGAIWPLAWHQLRRSTAVNMSASGLVSDATLQYQLKHLSRAMTSYYGRGYSAKAISRDMQAEFIKESLEGMARSSADVYTDRFISPYDTNFKFKILHDPTRVKHQTSFGNVAIFRRTVIGVCVKSQACEYGGFDNVSACLGSRQDDPCPNAMIDRERRSIMASLLDAKRQELEQLTQKDGRRLHTLSQILGLERAMELISDQD